MAELNPLQVPLHGHHLIEANAGTGKTFNIAALYLRLLLLSDLEVDQILVMTYTRAATAELRSRLEAWLREAVAQLGPTPSGANQRSSLVAQIIAQAEQPLAALADKLRWSLRNLDLAAIYTIHGFCKQVLDGHSFAAGVEVEVEFIGDDTLLVEQIFWQSWRSLSAELPAPLAAAVLGDRKFERLAQDAVRSAMQHPGCRVLLNPVDIEQVDRVLQQIPADVETVCQTWREVRLELVAILSDPGQFRGNSVQATRGAALIDLLDQLDPSAWRAVATQKDFSRLGADNIGWASSGRVQHRLFDQVQQLLDRLSVLADLQQRQQQLLIQQLVVEVERRLAEHKRQQKLRSYDDLVRQLHRALEGAGGSALVGRLRQHYRAGLVDEFQDTDPMQFAILRRIFSAPTGEEKPALFLVGDPKQALYNFRGADVFAYLSGYQIVDQVHSLSNNWRSTRELVAAVNRLFLSRPRPFVLPQIDYQASTANTGPSGGLSGLADSRPLQAWLLPVDQRSGRRLSDRQQLAELTAQRTVREIVRLLEQGRIDGDPVRPDHIAILVRKHEQGETIASALRQHGLACVQVGRQRIFQEPEAADLEAVLRAVNAPQASGLLRAALVSRLIGWSLADVAALANDDAALVRQTELFESLRQTWRERGLASLVMRLLIEFKLPSRLLTGDRGRRTLATLFQLLDLLYQQAALVDDPARLLRWLRARRSSREFDEDELLHLDSDAALIKIVTIHAAKGLQYPIVFCPFLWEAQRPDDLTTFHDEDGQFCIDLGTQDIEAGQGLASAERLSEELRLVYVALTRAELRCYFCWGVARHGQHAALRYLLHGTGEGAWDDGLKAFVGQGRGNSDQAKLDTAAQRLQALDIGVEKLDLAPPPIPSSAQRLPGLVALTPGRIPPSRRTISSFSALVHAPPAHGASSPVAGMLPAGATMGLLLHEVLETLADFQPDQSIVGAAVSRCLAKYGVARRWHEQIVERVQQCLKTTLDRTSGLSLAALAPHQMLQELSFDLRLRGTTLQSLERFLLAGQGVRPEAAARFLTGAIDLVFRWQGRYYIVDYKSNFLGPAATDYTVPALRESIRDARYDLQYLLYSVALRRWLSQREQSFDEERHFGGVYYLYLRGMNVESGPDSGVYFVRPEPATLAEIDLILGT